MMQSEKILIVDDDTDLLLDLSFLLSEVNQVIKAENSLKALRLFKKHHPHICIIDIGLPPYLQKDSRIEGIRLAEKLHAKYPQTKIILISKNHFPAVETNIPAFNFIQKPLRVNELLQFMDNDKNIIPQQ